MAAHRTAIEPVSQRPVVLVSHARACSSAFERIFIQNQRAVTCLHEPFGDAYWLGPERKLGRYEEVRMASGFSDATYKSVMDDIEEGCKTASSKSQRLFIKEMAFYLFPAPHQTASIARSFGLTKLEHDNPTVIPRRELNKFHFTFLIRNPRFSVPSYYRLTLAPHRDRSKVDRFNTDDAGYSELRRLFDYLRSERMIGPHVVGQSDHRTLRSTSPGVDICVVDAEDLLRDPDATLSAYCRSTGIPYDPGMLQWGNVHDQKRAASIINRWGFETYFHKAVLESKTLQSGTQPKRNSQDDYQFWVKEYGVEGAEVIQQAVELHMDDYRYLKQFALVT